MVVSRETTYCGTFQQQLLDPTLVSELVALKSRTAKKKKKKKKKKNKNKKNKKNKLNGLTQCSRAAFVPIGAAFPNPIEFISSLEISDDDDEVN
jgi:cytoskeletal protein RodZ